MTMDCLSEANIEIRAAAVEHVLHAVALSVICVMLTSETITSAT